ncbi:MULTISPECIES: hypothetical protein [Serratia]|uniref:hypothetical protein n=1 Tax=Serratia TaxID=613 RepID=UPI000BFFF67D|nr:MULTISPECIES: hypothetical protein [Serratia]KAB1496363.1 hypothetical protein F8R23_09100 [Serratia proteamaculans]MBV6694449.1 hypothetical protein [Serratia quinivorans]
MTTKQQFVMAVTSHFSWGAYAAAIILSTLKVMGFVPYGSWLQVTSPAWGVPLILFLMVVSFEWQANRKQK